METSADRDPAANASFRLYEIYRARVVAEDHLVNSRLTWILLLQAPLFAVVAGILLDAVLLSQQHSALGLYKNIQIVVLVLLGIFSFSFLAFGAWAVRAAFKEISYLNQRYAEVVTPHSALPSITGQEVRHFAGVVLPSMIIAGLTGCWVVILLFGITLLGELPA
jgi:hypothetical protein